VLLGGWRLSRSWVPLFLLLSATSCTMASLSSSLLLLLPTTLPPSLLLLLPSTLASSSSYSLLQLLAPEYQEEVAVDQRPGVATMAKRTGGLTYKRNGGVPDECRGKYDTSIYTQLDNICEDCYNLYKEADVHQFCRADCFSTGYFQKCLQALLLEEDRFLNMVQIIGKRR